MAESRAASRYVKSLLGLAVERGVIEEVHKDMQMFSKVCEQNRPFAVMLRSPVIRHEKKRAILEALFTGRVNKLTLAFIDIITRKNREPLLYGIASDFHNAYNEYKGVGQAFITTTIPMDTDLRKSIETVVRKLSDRKQVEIEEEVDPDLIGGFILKVGDQQIDASIRSKFRMLKLKFNENFYIKEF
jgi:F-type H+-transporting ATPase subunit delta